MRLERMKKTANSMSIDNTRNEALPCSDCVMNDYDAIDAGIDELVNIVGQANTAITRTLDNEVNICPAVQQWPV